MIESTGSNEPAVEERPGDAPWPMRPVLLAGIGLVAGLLAHLVVGAGGGLPGSGQVMLLAAITVGAGLFGFTLERRHWWASLGFALAMAGCAAAVAWWNGTPARWGDGEGWRVASLVLAIVIAAPLFQAARDAGGARFHYPWVHDHAWTNIVIWCAAIVFVGLSFAMLWLLASLFDLIKLDFLHTLLTEQWFGHALVGLTFGAAVGLLRELDAVVRLLQRIATTALAVLAPVLAVGLALFLLSLPFTGLQPLWDATDAATPVLLACLIGALVLANAVIGSDAANERRFPPFRFAAMVLGLAVLPLAIIAAVAIGLRIGQHGYTPERLWAATFVTIALVCGLAYLGALLLGRLEWARKVRAANLGLAFFVYVVALVLATPLVSFNAVSTRDQVARLESGRIAPDKFDWRALAFDFGQPGRDALNRLQRSANAAIRVRAQRSANATGPWQVADAERMDRNRTRIAANARVLPAGSAMPAGLRDALASGHSCVHDQGCTVLMLGATEAIRFDDYCFRVPDAPANAAARTAPVSVLPGSPCSGGQRFELADGVWREAGRLRAIDPAHAAAYRSGQVEVRSVPRRQVFVGGRPVGAPFE